MKKNKCISWPFFRKKNRCFDKLYWMILLDAYMMPAYGILHTKSLNTKIHIQRCTKFTNKQSTHKDKQTHISVVNATHRKEQTHTHTHTKHTYIHTYIHTHIHTHSTHTHTHTVFFSVHLRNLRISRIIMQFLWYASLLENVLRYW